MNKAILLDRDGVLNVERGTYTFLPDDFEIEFKVSDALQSLKDAGYLNIVITNQAGIAKGLYTSEQMNKCHEKLLDACEGTIDDIFYCPHHESVTRSLSRKPGTLMFERAIARYNLDPKQSWMIGDKERDLIPAKKFDIKTVHITDSQVSGYADFSAANLYSSLGFLL